MSFAAVIAIVALSEHPRFRAFAAARDEPMLQRACRALAVMLLRSLVAGEENAREQAISFLESYGGAR